jgi:hypothetical protein
MNVAAKGLVALAFLGLVTGYGCFGPPGISACGNATGFAPAMLEAVEHCPQAAERLGTPVHFGLIGVGCGNYEAGGDSGDGNAWGDIPVGGTRESASLDYAMSKGGNVWTSSKLVLTFSDGAKLDVHACAASFEAAKGEEALGTILQRACDEGQAAQCEALAARLESKNKPDEAKAFHQKACNLGLAAACATSGGVEPQK